MKMRAEARNRVLEPVIEPRGQRKTAQVELFEVKEGVLELAIPDAVAELCFQRDPVPDREHQPSESVIAEGDPIVFP
jgi:hypothetical protein